MSAEGVRIADQPKQLECMSIGPVVRQPHYGPAEDPVVKFGDVCFVDDRFWPDFAGMRMMFVATAYNVESGITWVELNGGMKGRQWTRAFPATSIRVPMKRSKP